VPLESTAQILQVLVKIAQLDGIVRLARNHVSIVSPVDMTTTAALQLCASRAVMESMVRGEILLALIALQELPIRTWILRPRALNVLLDPSQTRAKRLAPCATRAALIRRATTFAMIAPQDRAPSQAQLLAAIVTWGW
jgi:hypothetical protein